jgi:outer membrane immunogenic protein
MQDRLRASFVPDCCCETIHTPQGAEISMTDRCLMTIDRKMSSRFGRILTSAALLAGLLPSGASLAADLPVKARPQPAPVASWTGFYAGLNAGYGWGDASSTNNPVDPASRLFFLNPINFGSTDFNSSFRQEGWIAGGQAGYNWQFNSRGLMGIEADLQYADVNGRDSHRAFLRPGSFGTRFGFNAIAERRLQWFGSVRGRLGYLVTPDVLLYGTGGLAYGQTQSRGDVVLAPDGLSSITITTGGFTFDCGVTVAVPTPTCYTGSNTATQVGWTAGAGGEMKFSPNWSVKFEYLHVELPGTSVTLASPSPPSSPGVSTIYRFNRQAYDFVRVGINYQFGGPVVARY